MRLSDVERSRLCDGVNARLESAPNLNYLLGEVIRARIAQADDPTSYLVTLLSQNLPHWLQEMERLCTRYLAALVNRDDAIARVSDELLKGARTMPPKPFNNRMAGFIAELSALGELPPRRYSHFIPIPTSTVKTADYECRIDNVPACLEIKNINSPFGIFDVFDEMLGQRKKLSAYFRSISLKLECDDDNTATEIQKAEISRFLNAIDGGATRGMHDLFLAGEVKIRVEIQPGEGRVYMFRGCVLGTVRNVREEKFFEKVRSTVAKALSQLAKCPHQQRGVVLNIITPDAEFPMEWNTKVRNIVDEWSGSSVACEILFFHKYLDPGLAAGIAVEISE